MSRTNKAKLCLLGFAVLCFTFALTGTRATTVSFAYAEGPPPDHTGAPGEITCDTSGCHSSFALNSGPGQFTIQAPATYEPGQSYQITVNEATNDTSRKRWGFQLTALDPSNAKAGNLMATSTTQTLTDNGTGVTRQYIEHTVEGTFQGRTGGTSWTFTWVAPSSNVGAVTMYAAGNMANGDGVPTGDQIYTTKATIAAAAAGPPTISNVTASGKKLIVDGTNFDASSVVYVNDAKQKTLHPAETISTEIIGKKAAKNIAAGQTVMVKVKNGNGEESDEFPFMKPSN